jgi:molecular chaperone DnaJ
MLTNPEKREAYDRYGHAGVDPNMGGGGGWRRPAVSAMPATSSATSSAAAAAAAQARVYRGADLRYNLEITLEQAAHGFDTTIRVPSWDKCDTCHGSGAKPALAGDLLDLRRPARCMQQGFFSIQQTCPKCHGTGKIIPEPCAPARARAASSATRRWK